MNQATDWSALWQIDCQVTACEHCNNAYLVPNSMGTVRCPACQRDVLDPLEADAEQMAYTQPPEMVLGFAIDGERVVQQALKFTNEIPLRPKDIQPTTLRQRLQRVYLPVWLVDGEAQAEWKAEAGYFYEVVSHKEQLSGGQWRSREVKERRTRWEPRVGRLTRHYDNVPAPALERFAKIRRYLGIGNIAKANGYTPDAVQSAFVCLPDRSPADAWTEAVKGFQAGAAEDCRKAASADEIREFHWAPDVEGQNWTQLLLPFYSTYYLDDDGEPRMIYVNGQTGKIWGHRRASQKRARTTAMITIGAALLIFILSLIAFVVAAAVPPVAVLGVVGLIAAVGVGVIGPMQLIRASQFNKKYQGEWKFTL